MYVTYTGNNLSAKRSREDTLPTYLVESSKWIILSFICHSAPVMEYCPIFACWICEWHPFPWPNTATANLGLHLLVALIGVCRDQGRSISTNDKHLSQLTNISFQLVYIYPNSIPDTQCLML